MKICKNCGASLDDTDFACPKCGTRIDDLVPPAPQPANTSYSQQGYQQQGYQQPGYQQPNYPAAPPQPNYQQPYQPPQQAPATTTNGMAIAGFVLAFFFPLLGLIFSIVGMTKVKECHSGKGLALAGIIISAAWMGLAFIMIFSIAGLGTLASLALPVPAVL